MTFSGKSVLDRVGEDLLVTRSSSQLFGDSQNLRAEALISQRKTLTLRQLSGEEGFIQAVTCYPGQITVLRDSSCDEFKPFREALLGRVQDQSVDMRYGSDSLHPSEVHAVGISRNRWDHSSVRQAVLKSGVPGDNVERLLEEIGLIDKIGEPPATLEKAERRRLSIACSFFSKCSILLYNFPFSPTEAHWTDIMALFMLEGAELSQRIIIVFQNDALPGVWKSNSSVQVIETNKGSYLSSGISSAKGKIERIRESIKHLMHVPHSGSLAKDTYIITRPQIIEKSAWRMANPDAVKAEAIANPNMSNLIPSSEEETAGKSSNKKPLDKSSDYLLPPSRVKRKKSTSGHLTRTSLKTSTYRRLSMLFGLIQSIKPMRPDRRRLSNETKIYVAGMDSKKSSHLTRNQNVRVTVLSLLLTIALVITILIYHA